MRYFGNWRYLLKLRLCDRAIASVSSNAAGAEAYRKIVLSGRLALPDFPTGGADERESPGTGERVANNQGPAARRPEGG